MAKKKNATNITAAIREHLTQNPDDSAGKVVSELASAGVTVTTQQVYNVRSQLKRSSQKNTALKKRTVKKKPARKSVAKQTKSKASSQPAQPKSATATTEALFAARAYVDRLGGFEEARKAVDTLEKLQR